MKSILPAFIIVLFAVVVTGRAGNGPEEGGGTSANAAVAVTLSACSVQSDRPSFNRGAATIVARGSWRCDSPGAVGMWVNVFLQRQDAGGAWNTVVFRGFTAAGATTTRRGSSDAQRTREVSGGCAPGTYRTLVTAGYTYRGQAERQLHEESATVVNPCG